MFSSETCIFPYPG